MSLVFVILIFYYFFDNMVNINPFIFDCKLYLCSYKYFFRGHTHCLCKYRQKIWHTYNFDKVWWSITFLNLNRFWRIFQHCIQKFIEIIRYLSSIEKNCYSTLYRENLINVFVVEIQIILCVGVNNEPGQALLYSVAKRYQFTIFFIYPEFFL